MPYATINPATGQNEKTYPAHTPAEVEAILQRAADPFAEYRTTSYAERARHLQLLLDMGFEARAAEMALDSARGDVMRAAAMLASAPSSAISPGAISAPIAPAPP